MQPPVIGIGDDTGEYQEYIPKIYHNNEWQTAYPYVYINGEWQPIGQAGTLMLRLIASVDDEFHTTDDEIFQVRKHP